jgi:hypothetical protein
MDVQYLAPKRDSGPEIVDGKKAGVVAGVEALHY